MSKVNILPTEIVAKIAAGEVIERPSSVVKELVENSLDAGAKSISVSVKDAGKTLIKVSDNGCGIEYDDMEKIFLRHSTSKIRSVDDIYRISSLGFRGEALFSIGSIADVVLKSRASGQDTGWELHIRGGARISMKPVGMDIGTEIEVHELFFNTPARRKFIKQDATEISQILNTFLPYTISYPEISFSLDHQSRMLVKVSADDNYITRASRSLNINEDNIIETCRMSDDENITVHLLLGDINIQRARKDLQFIFVNGRPVQDKSISFHMNQAYRLLMAHNVYPFFAVFLDIPADSIDVNTHPAKREVKIKDERIAAAFIRGIAEKALAGSGHTKFYTNSWQDKPVSADSPSAQAVPDQHTHIQKNIDPSAPSDKQYVLYTAPGYNSSSCSASGPGSSLKDKLSDSKFIGTFLKKYLLFESGASVLFIDQHAAQERITYEKLLSQIKSGKVEIQHLLTPILVSLSPEEILQYNSLSTLLEKTGFSTTFFDDNTVAVHSHPQLIKNPELSVRNILSEGRSKVFDDETIARLACRSSIMAGDEVNKETAIFIKNRLISCDNPLICPHGRPTVIEIEDRQLNRQFNRT